MWSSILALSIALAAAPERPTFAEEIAPIIHQHCTPCHRPEGGAPMDFVSYHDVRKRSRMIARITRQGVMPPWKAEPGDYPFHNERRLTEAQIDLLEAWAKAGAPGGNLDHAPEPPVFDSNWTHGEPDLLLTMEEPYNVPADGEDIYRNFVIGMPDLPEGTWLKGLDYRPTAIETAHHVIFTLDTTGNARSLAEADTSGPGYDGMESNLDTNRLGIWAVGSHPHLFPEGVALAVEPGTDLVLSTHFHPVGKAEVERAEVAVYLTDEAPTRRMIELDVPFGFGLLTNMKIPPGDGHHVIRDTYTFHHDVLLSDLFPHAHYLGRTIKATATFPDGATRTLLHVADWDFAWQEHYRFLEPVAIPSGTRMDMEFVYDNSAENPRNPTQPPQRVTWGPASDDEMACMTMSVMVDDAEEEQALREEYAAWVRTELDAADFGLLKQLIRQGKLERLDWNEDGRIEFSEVVTTVARVIHRMRTTPDPSGVRAMLITEILRQTVWKNAGPYIIAGLVITALLLAGGMGLAGWGIYRIVRWRIRRKQQRVPRGLVEVSESR